MKIQIKIYENAMYPEIKLKISKCSGYKFDRESSGLCFYLFKKILIIGYLKKAKPLRKGYWEGSTRIRYSEPKQHETKDN